ncbi:MAG: T9SS type A sorting domain-containing protein [Bacteroidetes bacterium]|nr:T9SS type A sorting domain-containing protein [Bacteroidota bacterium]
MKHFLRICTLSALLTLQDGLLYSQQELVFKQLIVASGGNFSDPDDYVTLSARDAETGEQFVFDTIYTQAVQDVLVDNARAFVAATDSLVVYDLDTYQRIAAIACPGINQMVAGEDLLFVSFQYPETAGFIRAYKKNSLDLVQVFDQVSDEAAGMLIHNNTLFAAVPGGWMSTTGKIAMIDLSAVSFIEEVDLGSAAVGIFDLYNYNDTVYSVNRTPWGMTTASLTAFDPDHRAFVHHSFEAVFGKGVAVDGNKLYVMMNQAIGLVDLDNQQIIDEALIPDPGSENFTYFVAAEFDALNREFYTTVTDYFSFGEGRKFSETGEQLGLFDAGISPEAIGLDVRDITSVSLPVTEVGLQVYPNPARDFLFIGGQQEAHQHTLFIMNMQGVEVLRLHTSAKSIDVSGLCAGPYVILVSEGSGIGRKCVFIKQ